MGGEGGGAVGGGGSCIVLPPSLAPGMGEPAPAGGEGPGELQRQLEEVGVLRDIYGEGDSGGLSVRPVGEAEAQAWVAAGGCSGPPPSLGVRVDFGGPGRVVADILLPVDYPSAADPLVWVVGAEEEGWAEAARAAVTQVLDGLGGGGEPGRERLLDCLQAAEEALREAAEGEALGVALRPPCAGRLASEEEVRVDSEDECPGASVLLEDIPCSRVGGGEGQGGAAQVLGRRLCYSHHIINAAKRKAVVEWAVQLGLGGFSKIGWPGIIVVEGMEQNVEEYCRALQRLRWKHFTVRGEDTVTIPPGEDLDESRRLPSHFTELPEDGMSSLAAAMTAAGLRDLFLTSMKIYRPAEIQSGVEPVSTGSKRRAKKKGKGR